VPKREFTVVLDVPDAFNEGWDNPYSIMGATRLQDGVLMWTLWADAKQPQATWVKAGYDDEGEQVRARDAGEWVTGKLLHFDEIQDSPYLVLLDGSLHFGWFRECERCL